MSANQVVIAFAIFAVVANVLGVLAKKYPTTKFLVVIAGIVAALGNVDLTKIAMVFKSEEMKTLLIAFSVLFSNKTLNSDSQKKDDDMNKKI